MIKIKSVKQIISYVLVLALVLGNVAFSKVNTNAAALSNITGRTFFFLGSSVTYGSASGGVSFADYIASRNNCTSVKQAVSGTTLVNNGSSSYVERIKNFDTAANPDHFICQLSTNDASQGKPLGTLSSSYNINDFDTTTIMGAIEYIIAYTKNTWGCPVAFYTGTYYDSANYQAMVDALYQIKGKWGIGIIDLWNDAEMRSVSSSDYSRYMADSIHPTAVGYEEWWTPKFEAYLQSFDYSSYDTSGLVEVFGMQVENPSSGTISVVWGNPGNDQLFNVYLDGALAVSTTGATLSNVACAYYTIPASEGNHTIKVTSTLNGKETVGVSQTITVSGSSETTTAAATIDGYTTAGANWTELDFWSVYFASGWANNPTGSYKDGGSYNDFGVYVNTASLTEWGIQLKTKDMAVTSGKSYTCKVTVESNMEVTNNVRFKEEITQTEKLYTLTKGTNTLELPFTSGSSAQIFFDLGMLPAGVNFVITSFSLTNNEEVTTEAPTVEETTTAEPENENVIIATEGLEINGYQISATVGGMRSVYSVEATINGKEVVESGFVYSLADYTALSDLYVGSSSEYVASFKSTETGLCSQSYSQSETATSYAMTMKFSNKNAAEYNAVWRIRAYAKLSDGTYVYTTSEEYQIFDIAEKLYQRELMSNETAHDYLFTDILKVVNVNYTEIEYSMDKTLAKW